MAWAIGNRYGRQGAPVTDAIRRAAMSGDQAMLRRAADRLIDSAANGASWAERLQCMQFIADRLEGKAVARVETANAELRELDLAAIVQAVMLHRKSEAVEAEIVPSERLPSPE